MYILQLGALLNVIRQSGVVSARPFGQPGRGMKNIEKINCLQTRYV